MEQGRRFTHPAQFHLHRKPAPSEDFPGKPPDEKDRGQRRPATDVPRRGYARGHYQLGGLSSGTGRNCKEGQEIRSCREMLYRQIPILQLDRVRSLRQALPAKNYYHRSGVDLQHLQLSGPFRLSLQADTGVYADGHDRRFGYWRFNGNHSRGQEHAGISLQRR